MAYSHFSLNRTLHSPTPCYLPIKNRVVSMMTRALSRTVLEPLFAVIAGM